MKLEGGARVVTARLVDVFISTEASTDNGLQHVRVLEANVPVHCQHIGLAPCRGEPDKGGGEECFVANPLVALRVGGGDAVQSGNGDAGGAVTDGDVTFDPPPGVAEKRQSCVRRVVMCGGEGGVGGDGNAVHP